MEKISGYVKQDGYEVWFDSESSEKVSRKYSKFTDGQRASANLEFAVKAQFVFNDTVSESEGSKSRKPVPNPSSINVVLEKKSKVASQPPPRINVTLKEKSEVASQPPPPILRVEESVEIAPHPLGEVGGISMHAVMEELI